MVWRERKREKRRGQREARREKKGWREMKGLEKEYKDGRYTKGEIDKMGDRLWINDERDRKREIKTERHRHTENERYKGREKIETTKQIAHNQHLI